MPDNTLPPSPRPTISSLSEENRRLRSKISALEAQCNAITSALVNLTDVFSKNDGIAQKQRRLTNFAVYAEASEETRRSRMTAAILRQLAAACSTVNPENQHNHDNTTTGAATEPFDAAVSPWISLLEGFLERGIPSAYRIWQLGKKFEVAGNEKAAKQCVQLNYLLHNSSIPNTVVIGENSAFGYGGIGVVLHASAEIGKGVVIGANITLGGKSNSAGKDSENSKSKYVPKIGDYVYLSTGCKVLGGVHVGALSIIGANAVVISDIPPLSVAAGAPAVVRRHITPENCMQYRSHFPALKNLTKKEFVSLITEYSKKQKQD